MRIKALIEEDFVNYKKPSLFIACCSCTFKCCTEAGIPISTCQNCELSISPVICMDDYELVERYKNNPLTQAVVVGGLEPFDQFSELDNLICSFRTSGVKDDFVIYTGYYEDEIQPSITKLKEYGNVIVKFGRYKPQTPPVFDEVLGVTLVSDNQYAKYI